MSFKSKRFCLLQKTLMKDFQHISGSGQGKKLSKITHLEDTILSWERYCMLDFRHMLEKSSLDEI